MYSKLSTPRTTRVLFLASASSAPDNVVRCDWTTISVDDPEPYWALSYVWGDPNLKECDLLCNDYPVKITSNLWAALRAFWSTLPDARIWVDMICINQEDISERNQQVGMMGDIYRRAETVAVWLGDATQKTDDFFKVCRMVEAGESLTLDNCPRPVTEEKSADTDIQRARMYYLLDCGQDVAHRSWFLRAWTFQEIRLATKARVYCGPHMAGFGLFLEAVTRINGISQRQDFCGARLVNARMFAPASNFKSLYRLIALTQVRQSSDPRDKIFSLLSMLPRGLYDFMKPDYSLSYEEVFAYACRVCIEVDNEMNILAGAGIRFRDVAVERSKDLPSWAVDFRVFHDDVQYWRNLSRSIKFVNPEVQRARLDLGETLDPKNKAIRIPGVASGRFIVDEERHLAILRPFPPCATKSFQFKDAERVLYVDLSELDFSSMFHRLRLHDAGECHCDLSKWHSFACACLPCLQCFDLNVKNTGLTSTYRLYDMPAGLTSGDWLWTTQQLDSADEEPQAPVLEAGKESNMSGENNENGVIEEESRERVFEDEIHHFHYGIRPVEDGEDTRFLLVGKTNGLREVDVDGQDVYHSDTRHLVVQTTFVFM